MGLKLRLFVVGKGASELADYEARFVKRLRAFSQFEVIELNEGRGSSNQMKLDEEKRLLSRMQAPYILFDERGEPLTSKGWAGYLQEQAGNASLDFVIGGANGFTDRLRSQAFRCWSLSPQTLPHQLARVMVTEQLYRAFTILRGHPYHRE
ncbi:MAG: 23S rRNA (pseudouridine(1915)-N(3))-methyltransferase RlmH [Mariprofundaceae bacterium]